MLAVVNMRKHSSFVEIREVPEPEPTPNEVIVVVEAACRRCDTDY